MSKETTFKIILVKTKAIKVIKMERMIITDKNRVLMKMRSV